MVTEFNLIEAIDEWLDGKTDYVPEVEAGKLVAYLFETRADDLHAWLAEHAASIIADRMNLRRSVKRRQARQQAAVSDFAAVAEMNDAAYWDQWWFRCDDENRQLRVDEMTGPDHIYVASTYEATGKAALMEAAFHRAVAKKVGRRKTGDVFTPEKFQALRASITGSNQAA